MNGFDHCVVLIARDASLVDAVASASQVLGYPLKHFESIGAWLDEITDDSSSPSTASPSLFGGVIVLERIVGTEQSVLEIQQVCDLRHGLPVIVLSRQLTVADAVAAMRDGAFTVLMHACPTEELSDAISSAVALAQERLPGVLLATTAARRWQKLSDGERAVMQQLLDGRPNKEIAHLLEIGLRTVELRRSRIMEKMQVGSLAELVQAVCAAQSIL